MASLEDLSPAEQQAAANLLAFVNKNPDIAKQIRRKAKEQDPNFRAPDIEMEDKLEEQQKAHREEIARLDKERLEDLQVRRRAEAHDKIRAAGLTPEDVEKVMVDQKIGDYDTAIRYVQQERALAKPTAESMSPHSMPDNKDLWKNRNAFARTEAFSAINDLRSGRAIAR
jgi:hypothetical protein